MLPDAVALFLFAHQDDEFGVFEHIARYRQQGVRVLCAYLTDGATASASSATRNAESRRVLGQLGVADNDIIFAGEQLGIGDACLPLHLVRAGQWLENWFDSFARIEAIHVLAWEGGHQDHDALHALTVVLAERRGLLSRCWQFPLYQAHGLRGRLLHVLAPLSDNGPVTMVPIAWRRRLFYLRLCLTYRSQHLIWIGLLPLVALHYIGCGTEQRQPVSLARLVQRPHDGKLGYEIRRFFCWPRLLELLTHWRASLDSHPTTQP